jgi:hypothetical protein
MQQKRERGAILIEDRAPLKKAEPKSGDIVLFGSCRPRSQAGWGTHAEAC